MKPTALKHKQLSPDEIVVGERFREDLGPIEQLAESIKQKGILQPLVLNKNGELLAGGRRLAASKLAGLTKVPCVIVETEDELDEREIELYENIFRKDMEWPERSRLTKRIHELLMAKHSDDWSERKTAQMLGLGKSTNNYRIEMASCLEVFPELADEKNEHAARKKLKRMIESVVVQEALTTQEAETKTAVQAVKWAANHYHIGDCLKAMRKMHDGIVHFAEVDPPYAINLGEHRRDTSDISEYNEVSIEDYPKFISATATQVYRVLYQDAFCVWWFGPSWYHEVLGLLRDVGFHVDEIPAIWNKQGVGTTTGNLDTYLARGYEPFFICRKGKPPIRKRGRSNVFDYQGVSTAERVHPTERPIELVREILRTFAYPKARVLSPFLGSGNTIVASYLEGMTGFGWDLSKHYKERYLARVMSYFPEKPEEPENESN